MCICCERKKNQKKVVEEDRCDGLGSGSCALSVELTDGVELEDGWDLEKWLLLGKVQPKVQCCAVN